jgi:hypothetical protein
MCCVYVLHVDVSGWRIGGVVVFFRLCLWCVAADTLLYPLLETFLCGQGTV